MWKSFGTKATAGVAGLFVLFSLASAIEINGYTPSNHLKYDRFSSGYPSAPVTNTDGSFIGLGYDWSGVGWNPSNPTQSVALLAPGFFLYANHYPPGSTLNFFSSDGLLKTYTVKTLSGYIDGASSDLGVGVLSSPIPASDHVTYYPIRFLGYSASSYSSNYYNGVSGYNNILVYGRQGDGSTNGPRIGKDTITSVYDNGVTLSDGSYHTGKYFYYSSDTTTADIAHIEPGDSGSPSFFYNSTTHQLYLSGAHFASSFSGGPITYSIAIDSALPLMLNYVNAYMAQTGYLPYVVTPSSATWNGADGQWGTPTNWSVGEGTGIITEDSFTSGQVTTCASLVFDGSSSTASRTISLGNTQRSVTGITFKSAAGANAFTFNSGGAGGILRIGEAGIVNNDDDTQTINCNVLLRTSQRWNAAQGGFSVSGSIDTDTGCLLLIDGSGNTTLSGAISNAGGIAKDGSGTLTLNNSGNSYTGGTWIHAGTLALGNSNVIPNSSSLVIDGGTLAIDVNSNTINSITLQSGSISGSAGVLSSSSFDVRTGTITANLSGGGTMGKSSSGTVVLSGTNSYTGGTIINGGVLQFSTSAALPSSGNITINSGGTLQGSGAYSQVGGMSGWLYSGRIVGSSAGSIALVQDEGNINMAGYASLSLGAIGNVTYTGTLTPVNNIYRLGGGGGTLTVNSNLVDVSSRSLVVGGGDGTVVLAGTGDNYSGGTTVSAGTLRLGNASVLGSTLASTTVASGATLDVNGYTVTLGSLSGQGVVSLPGGKISIGSNNNGTTFSGTISGTGQLEKIGSGTLSLSGGNTYSGITTISGGTLQIGGGGATGTLGTNSVVNNTDLWFNRSDNITVSNLISGSGNVQQKGAGILTLSGANGYSGTTTVASGTLKLANISALGTTAGGTIVQSGGVLDLNGLSIGNEALTINGTGSSGNGALVNSNASVSAVFNGSVTLGSNASGGGSGNITLNGAMNYANFALTKTGTNTLTLAGSQNWGSSSSASVTAGTLSYQQAAGALTAVAASTPTLNIASGATLNVNASNNDPFTDDTLSTRHVQITDASTGNFNLTAGIASVAGISGAGSTTVSGVATLYTSFLYQNALTIAPGSIVVINPIGGSGPLSDLPINALQTSISDSVLINSLAASPTDTSLGLVQTVPEPAMWILIVLGALCLIFRRIGK